MASHGSDMWHHLFNFTQMTPISFPTTQLLCCFSDRIHPSAAHMCVCVCVWKCCVPLNPMVLLILIPMKNGYFIGNIPYFQTNPYVFPICFSFSLWSHVMVLLPREVQVVVLIFIGIDPLRVAPDHVDDIQVTDLATWTEWNPIGRFGNFPRMIRW